MSERRHRRAPTREARDVAETSSKLDSARRPTRLWAADFQRWHRSTGEIAQIPAFSAPVTAATPASEVDNPRFASAAIKFGTNPQVTMPPIPIRYPVSPRPDRRRAERGLSKRVTKPVTEFHVRRVPFQLRSNGHRNQMVQLRRARVRVPSGPVNLPATEPAAGALRPPVGHQHLAQTQIPAAVAVGLPLSHARPASPPASWHYVGPTFEPPPASTRAGRRRRGNSPRTPAASPPADRAPTAPASRAGAAPRVPAPGPAAPVAPSTPAQPRARHHRCSPPARRISRPSSRRALPAGAAASARRTPVSDVPLVSAICR